jgi:hypothetical protein
MEYQRMRYDIFVLIIGLLGGFFSWWLGKDLIGFFLFTLGFTKIVDVCIFYYAQRRLKSTVSKGDKKGSGRANTM